MNKVIEIKYCENCGKNPVHPPRRKYCSEACYIENKRQQDAERYHKRKEEQLSLKRKFSELSHEKDQLSHNPSNALELYNQELSEDYFIKLLQKAFPPAYIQKATSPMFLELANRIERVDMLVRSYSQEATPPREADAIQRAIALLEAYGDIEIRSKTRRRLEDLLQITKWDAERIIRKADRIVKLRKDPDQKRLDTWEEDEE